MHQLNWWLLYYQYRFSCDGDYIGYIGFLYFLGPIEIILKRIQSISRKFWRLIAIFLILWELWQQIVLRKLLFFKFFFFWCFLFFNNFSQKLEWLHYLKFINTGTYNSQWMILDLNKITSSIKKTHLEPNSLIVAEQIPGDVISEDMSSRLLNVFHMLFIKHHE